MSERKKMGCTMSSEELQAQFKLSKEIDSLLRKDARAERAGVKILLLGSGCSGKSTFAKQMRLLYGDGFTDNETKKYVDVICLNLLCNIKALASGARKLGLTVSEANKAIADDLENTKFRLSDAQIEVQRRVLALKSLLEDDGIQAMLARVNEIQLDDSAPYFFKNLSRIAEDNFVPSTDDLLNLRVRTTGIMETTFVYESLRIQLMDVGGQKNERKKWIHCFQDVTAILFVIGTSDYDLKLEEDLCTNRMEDALALFNDVINNKWFASTDVVVFLNKKDVFAEKITRVPLTVAFPEYDGPAEYDAGMGFIQSKIQSINSSHTRSRELYFHQTCATDTKAVKVIFEAVTLALFQEAFDSFYN